MKRTIKAWAVFLKDGKFWHAWADEKTADVMAESSDKVIPVTITWHTKKKKVKK